MSESTNRFDLPAEPPQEKFPWALAVIIVVVLALVAAWIWDSRSGDVHQDAAAAAFEKELDTDKAALDSEKDKLQQMSQTLDAAKLKIDLGQSKGRQAIHDYNELAKAQQAERDKYVAMAQQYNEKVNRYHQMRPNQ